MQVKPASVTVIAILHFVFGGLGIVIGICSGVYVLAGGQNWMTSTTGTGPSGVSMQQMQDDFQKAMESGPAFHAVQVGTVAVDLAVSIIMIVSGIGLLNLRPWGRRLSIVYAGLSIALKLFETIYGIAFTLPAVNEFVNSHTASAPEEQFFLSIARMTVLVPPVIQLVCMIYPIIVLIIMFRPAIVAAFRDGGALGRQPYEPCHEEADYKET